MLHDPGRLLTRARGLAVEPDQRRRFAYPVADADDALRWVRSLYLPGSSPRRIRAAQRHPSMLDFQRVGLRGPE